MGALKNMLSSLDLRPVSRDAGTVGGQEGQLPPLPFAGRGKGGKSAL